MSGKSKDLSGQKFGRLTALYKLNNYHKRATYWLCVCDCGNLREVQGGTLINGRSRSCGCLVKDTNSTHGKTNTRLYHTWNNIKARCYNHKNKRYENYGARGIVMCDEWKKDFQVFYDWATNSGYKDNLQIDRIDVNGNYEPNNCRWVDVKTQQRNKSNNKLYTLNGETKCLSEWCEILNLKYWTVRMRLYRGWSVERALELEV